MKTVLIYFGHNFETPAIVLGWLAFKSLESLEKIVEASVIKILFESAKRFEI